MDSVALATPPSLRAPAVPLIYSDPEFGPMRILMVCAEVVPGVYSKSRIACIVVFDAISHADQLAAVALVSEFMKAARIADPGADAPLLLPHGTMTRTRNLLDVRFGVMLAERI